MTCSAVSSLEIQVFGTRTSYILINTTKNTRNPPPNVGISNAQTEPA